MSITGADLPALLPGLLPRLWAFALRISGDRHDAEDLVQLACVRALERAHQLQPDTSVLSWMFSIVHSTWINELRSRNVRSRSRQDWNDELLETVSDPNAQTPETDLLHHQILTAVEQLPDTQREVMLLVGVERFSYKEAAEILDLPIGTVMSRLSRARQAIGALFGAEKSAAAKRSAPPLRTRPVPQPQFSHPGSTSIS
ncbi:RNA polymerase subunit sigma-70 [Pseudomonas gingeri NCPPB 3146 = LMG 5327]|uniref:RNA polymerase sigma factor n=2 Tax=Pseudomonas gingeri TaxID=117681 RepID=A0A7Y7Y4J8_9PSED|nr:MULTISPECIES: RNA polymerase sigma factor [Pseudomonas]NVZ27760.1 RNA polymerase sigma factor [Pseudomonas gingeri]NWC17584.1 RNA polymerase sigma factor [Pseudomonas gingeri]NWE46636.1 RNA polymerase sigma factor [Pseudomonas gingeri]NWE72348.1 RNA polymerase sigma factor [Pseudomonas gingeri]PNQ88041.1 RNA polymerase subunit sigma-70 [Pseudomonas gingeri NCPPB 3146 = LMG 5327]